MLIDFNSALLQQPCANNEIRHHKTRMEKKKTSLGVASHRNKVPFGGGMRINADLLSVKCVFSL